MAQRSPLTAAQQDLATRYIPMARSLAKPMKAAWPLERDELDSAALLALVEAAQAFEPERNIKFGTYARYRIWGALRDTQRRLMVEKGRVDPESAVHVVRLSPETEAHGRVLNATPDRPLGEEDEAIEWVERCLRKLPAKHAAACRAIYIDGQSQSEAARTLGYSKSRLSVLHRESLALLGEALANDARAYEGRHAAPDLAKPRTLSPSRSS